MFIDKTITKTDQWNPVVHIPKLKITAFAHLITVANNIELVI